MTEDYSVRISKDHLVFSVAHFITLDSKTCESLHGHGYRVSAEIFGPLGKNHYVVDFILLRDTLKTIVDELDHHVLLPSKSNSIRLSQQSDEITVLFKERRWVFPKSDCLVLPIESTTTECLARYVADSLFERLEGKVRAAIKGIEVEVDECYGQSAICRISL